MSSGSIVPGNIIRLTSKIILKYTKNVIKFSCKAPIFATGYILQGKKYKCNILLPKKIFNDLQVDTFYGVDDSEKICIKICDMLDTDSKIHISIGVGERKDNHCGMYSFDLVICPEITICNPVIFLCGKLIRKEKMFQFINVDDNNAHGIKMFISCD